MFAVHRKKLIQALHEKDTEAVNMLKGTPRKAGKSAIEQIPQVLAL